VSRREDADLMLAFQRHYMGPNRDLDAALREVYDLGFRDGRAKQRRRRANRSTPLASRSDRIKDGAARAMPFIVRIAKRKNLKPESLIEDRDATTTRDRQETYWILRELTKCSFSYPEIAAAFNKKDHSAVIHGCKKVEERFTGDPGLEARLRGVARRVGAAA
jgi:hypothetical protein